MCHDFNLTKEPFKDDNGRYCRFTSPANDTNGRNTRAHKRVQSRENTMEESSNAPCYWEWFVNTGIVACIIVDFNSRAELRGHSIGKGEGIIIEALYIAKGDG